MSSIGKRSARPVSAKALGSLAGGLIPCDNCTRPLNDATEHLRSTDVHGSAATNLTGVTQILASIERGDPHAAEQLLPLVYDELRRLAAARMATESPDHTLQATALVHEAYLRLVNVEQAQHWNSRGHFFGAAAEAMRRILVEQARRRLALKRGRQQVQTGSHDLDVASTEDPETLLAIHDALDALAEADPQSAELVKLRYFGGLPMHEAAEALGISTRQAHYVWAYARSWLARALHDE